MFGALRHADSIWVSQRSRKVSFWSNARNASSLISKFPELRESRETWLEPPTDHKVGNQINEIIGIFAFFERNSGGISAEECNEKAVGGERVSLIEPGRLQSDTSSTTSPLLGN